MLKAIQLPRSNYLITYCETLDAVTWLLRQEKKTNYKCFKKNLKKIAKSIKNFLKVERLNC